MKESKLQRDSWEERRYPAMRHVVSIKFQNLIEYKSRGKICFKSSESEREEWELRRETELTGNNVNTNLRMIYDFFRKKSDTEGFTSTTNASYRAGIKHLQALNQSPKASQHIASEYKKHSIRLNFHKSFFHYTDLPERPFIRYKFKFFLKAKD